ncbi:MAG TPA: hypothetical protein VNW28_06970 [Chthoniobacterales bacterium]|nr:hypothetical protein [Chthoniobacterales bacterium]
MTRLLALAVLFLATITARAQIEVDLKFKRLQYIAYEPVIATVTITNLAGREIELRDDTGQHWYGFEVTANEGRTLAPLRQRSEPPLKIAAGTSVTRKIDLTPLFPITDRGVYHARANVYFADLNKFFYARAKVFEVTNARPIWQRTVGNPGADGVRTYSLLTNRFPDHTSLYVRVEDKANSLVYATYSLGRLISFDEPHAEVDRNNQLHVLQCSAPRLWSYSVVGLDGRLAKHTTYTQTRTSPHLRRAVDGTVAVAGGMVDAPVAPLASGKEGPKLSDRPADLPLEN